MFKKVWDTVMDFIYSILEWALNFLPLSPFQSMTNSLANGPFENILNYINYFVPVGLMITFFTSYVACVAIWYVVRWAMRLTKYIQ
ncbi:MAG: hypothetical protein RR557_07100 [Bacilli bacterium]